MLTHVLTLTQHLRNRAGRRTTFPRQRVTKKERGTLILSKCVQGWPSNRIINDKGPPPPPSTVGKEERIITLALNHFLLTRWGGNTRAQSLRIIKLFYINCL